MKQTSGPTKKAPSEAVLKGIRRAPTRLFSAEKIRIILESLRREDSIPELCCREGSSSSVHYGWSKEILEGGKKWLAGDTSRAATSDEVEDLRRRARVLKQVVADLTLEDRLLKTMSGAGDGDA
jgi:transposase